MAVRAAPSVNGVMTGAQLLIRSEVSCPRHSSGWSLRAYDVTLLKPTEDFDPNFEPDAIVPVNCNVSAGRRLLCTQRVPHQPAALGHDARQLGRTGFSS